MQRRNVELEISAPAIWAALAQQLHIPNNFTYADGEKSYRSKCRPKPRCHRRLLLTLQLGQQLRTQNEGDSRGLRNVRSRGIPSFENREPEGHSAPAETTKRKKGHGLSEGQLVPARDAGEEVVWRVPCLLEGPERKLIKMERWKDAPCQGGAGLLSDQ